MSSGHCLHAANGTRFCCWCALSQEKVYENEELHGPRFSGERFGWHWEPPSTGACARDAVDQDVEEVA
jgi:hypothetical protein